MWYLDSGCSKHMTGDASKFLSITLKQDEHVTSGDNNKGEILCKGTVENENSLLIHDVLYVESLKHNLLSISQLCDRGYQVSLEQILVRFGCQIQKMFYSLVRDLITFICLIYPAPHQ